jgi:hypothetical protein
MIAALILRPPAPNIEINPVVGALMARWLSVLQQDKMVRSPHKMIV